MRQWSSSTQHGSQPPFFGMVQIEPKDPRPLISARKNDRGRPRRLQKSRVLPSGSIPASDK